jgi:hypothetical protein
MAPDKIRRLSVEYNMTQHCNLSCYACDHASPLLPEKYAVLAEFSRDLEALAAAFHSTELRIVGGEPLLHPDLVSFLEEARRIGISDSIVLYTNGVLLHEASAKLWQLIDELRLSAYPGVHRRLGDEECARLCAAHGVKLTLTEVGTFYKSLLGQRLEDGRLVDAIFRACDAANECHTVQDGYFYRCSSAPILGPFLALRGIEFDNRRADGVRLQDNRQLRDDLERCLTGSKALAACAYCLGTSGPPVAHHQLNRRGCDAWLGEDDQPAIDTVRARLLGKSWLQRLLAITHLNQ